jgi:hypothetical protein
MKRLAMVLMIGVFAASSLPCRAEPACMEVAVEASVEAGPGELTLADLLGRGMCPQLREAAARVSLGAVPRPGSVRVLDGREVRRLVEAVAGTIGSVGKNGGMTIPPRVVVRRRGATKSCAEIARFVAGSVSSQDMANVTIRWREDLDCAGARGIAADAPLELTKSGWSEALGRWEFALRCARPEDCVPFLVWVQEPKAAAGEVAATQGGASRRVNASAESSLRLRAGGSGVERLVAPGQTATLTWDQAGIRVVVPVTCLDAGVLGQFVRVRLKNAERILRAEVVGAGTLRASL